MWIMLKMCRIIYVNNNMDIMASMGIDIFLVKIQWYVSVHNMRVVTCIQSSNNKVFNPEGSSPRACILLQKFNQEDVTIMLDIISILLYL